MNAVWALVPVKPSGSAKTRLSGLLSAAERGQLFQAMLTDVLAALSTSARVTEVAIVSSRARAGQVVARYDAHLLIDQERGGLNGALQQAAHVLLRRGAGTMLIVPADVPLVTPDAIDRLIAAHAVRGTAGVTLVPDLGRGGTNGMILTPPDLLQPCYGPDSFRRHWRAAEELGISPISIEIPGLAMDIDMPDDLSLLAGAGGATGQLLAETDWLQRMQSGWPRQGGCA